MTDSMPTVVDSTADKTARQRPVAEFPNGSGVGGPEPPAVNASPPIEPAHRQECFPLRWSSLIAGLHIYLATITFDLAEAWSFEGSWRRLPPRGSGPWPW
jgi:hypothetical protein